MPDVLVVGGGVIGCATAYVLAREGASVTLIERGELAELGSESSGAAAGMLAALSDEGRAHGPAFRSGQWNRTDESAPSRSDDTPLRVLCAEGLTVCPRPGR